MNQELEECDFKTILKDEKTVIIKHSLIKRLHPNPEITRYGKPVIFHSLSYKKKSDWMQELFRSLSTQLHGFQYEWFDIHTDRFDEIEFSFKSAQTAKLWHLDGLEDFIEFKLRYRK